MSPSDQNWTVNTTMFCYGPYKNVQWINLRIICHIIWVTCNAQNAMTALYHYIYCSISAVPCDHRCCVSRHRTQAASKPGRVTQTGLSHTISITGHSVNRWVCYICYICYVCVGVQSARDKHLAILDAGCGELNCSRHSVVRKGTRKSFIFDGL